MHAGVCISARRCQCACMHVCAYLHAGVCSLTTFMGIRACVNEYEDIQALVSVRACVNDCEDIQALASVRACV